MMTFLSVCVIINQRDLLKSGRILAMKKLTSILLVSMLAGSLALTGCDGGVAGQAQQVHLLLHRIMVQKIIQQRMIRQPGIQQLMKQKIQHQMWMYQL